MPLIKENRFAPDPWVAVDDDTPLPEGAPAIVSLERWQAERDRLSVRNAPLGIRLRSDQPPKLVAEDLERFQVVALEFPKFTDGRAYSSARLLRERYGYRGELRAVGHVLRDQALFMLRCGFDAFEVAAGTSPEAWRAASEEISVFYQPTRDGRRAVPGLRHREGAEGTAGRPPAGPETRAERDREPTRAAAPAPALPLRLPSASPVAAVAGHWAY